MTLQVPVQGRTRSYAATLANTSVTTVFTAKEKTQSVVVAINLANIDGVVEVDATVEWYRASNTTSYKLGYLLSVLPGASIEFDFPLALDPSDELRVTASAASDLAVIVTVVETPGNA